MKFSKFFALVVAAALFLVTAKTVFAATPEAPTITVDPKKSVYTSGETVTITVVVNDPSKYLTFQTDLGITESSCGLAHNGFYIFGDCQGTVITATATVNSKQFGFHFFDTYADEKSFSEVSWAPHTVIEENGITPYGIILRNGQLWVKVANTTNSIAKDAVQIDIRGSSSTRLSPFELGAGDFGSTTDPISITDLSTGINHIRVKIGENTRYFEILIFPHL